MGYIEELVVSNDLFQSILRVFLCRGCIVINVGSLISFATEIMAEGFVLRRHRHESSHPEIPRRKPSIIGSVL